MDQNVTSAVTSGQAAGRQDGQPGAAQQPAAALPTGTAAGPFAIGGSASEPGKKRAVTQAMSPGHLEKVAQDTPSSFGRLQALVWAGFNKEVRDKTEEAVTTLELTKTVRVLEAAMLEHGEFLKALREEALTQAMTLGGEQGRI